MGCYKPLIRFYVPDNPEASGHIYTLRRFAIERAKNPNLTYEDLIYRKDVMLIPCGKCIGCRIQKKQDWATRIEMEAKTHPPESVWFVTLTYDDEHIPGVNHETGEVIRGAMYIKRKKEASLAVNQTLWYEDIQNFLKRLRKAYSRPLRYFVAGEYGEHTGRPHYHMILFGYEPEKLEPYRKVRSDGYMVDSRITKCWGMGLHNLINPTQGGYSYVSGYVVKKFDDETKEHIKNGLRPPFAQMSRDPGLGMQYYQEHKEEIWKNGFIQLDNGKRASIPRYFQEMQKQEDPRIVWELKRQNQQRAIEKTRDMMGRTDIKFEDYLKAKEDSVKHRRKSSGKF
jgi:hypothetical protein